MKKLNAANRPRQVLRDQRKWPATLMLSAAALVLSGGFVIADEIVSPPGLAGDTANRTHESKFRQEMVSIALEPGEQMEYVLDMKQGDPLLYSWSSNEGPIYSDFHAAPEDGDEYPDNYWIRYEVSENHGANGAVVAPFDGHTAWYWVNRNDHPVTLSLELVGYFTANEIAFREVPE